MNKNKHFVAPFTIKDYYGYIWQALCHPIDYTLFLWFKYIKCRNREIAKWSTWYIPEKTRREILKNGWRE